MPYVKEIVKAGKTIEVYKHYSSRYGKKNIPRGVNSNPTPENVKDVNERHSEKRLRWTINENFGAGDFHIVLTYRKDTRPTLAESKIQREKFLRQLRALYKKHGQELKYIAVTEYKNTAIHHHLIINSFDLRLIAPLWKYGKLRPTFLDDTGQYGQLAHYLIKETKKSFRDETSPIKKRWSASKNLKIPRPRKKIIKANEWQKDPNSIKGYYIDKDSINNGAYMTGPIFQFYIMRKIE